MKTAQANCSAVSSSSPDWLVVLEYTMCNF